MGASGTRSLGMGVAGWEAHACPCHSFCCVLNMGKTMENVQAILAICRKFGCQFESTTNHHNIISRNTYIIVIYVYPYIYIYTYTYIHTI